MSFAALLPLHTTMMVNSVQINIRGDNMTSKSDGHRVGHKTSSLNANWCIMATDTGLSDDKVHPDVQAVEDQDRTDNKEDANSTAGTESML